MMWNVHGRNMNTRTNNHCEGFLSRWNSKIGRHHPNLWHLIKKLQEEEHFAQLDKRRATDGINPPSRKRKWRDLEERISNMKAQLARGDRTLEGYWKAVSHIMMEF